MTRAVAKQGFTMIPDAIAHRTDIGPLAKNIFGFMVRKARNGRVTLGTRFFAEFWGSSKSRVAYAITHLEEVGLIAVERTGVGKRYIYIVLQHQNKASDSGTLSENKSGHWRDTPATGGTEAATGGTRKRLRPLETNTYMPPSSENGAEGKKKPLASELHESVVALFFPSTVPECRMSYVRRYVRELRRFSATPAEVRTRHKQWTELGYSFPCTLKTLVEHWDGLKPKPPNPYHPQAENPHG